MRGLHYTGHLETHALSDSLPSRGGYVYMQLSHQGEQQAARLLGRDVAATEKTATLAMLALADKGAYFQTDRLPGVGFASAKALFEKAREDGLIKTGFGIRPNENGSQTGMANAGLITEAGKRHLQAGMVNA